MRFTQLSALIAAAALSVGSVSAFAKPVQLTDTVGRKVTVDLPAKRVVLGFYYQDYMAIGGKTALDNVVGFSKAVNLTDGIDGLASISVVISLSAYGVIAYVQGQMDILLVILAMIGGLLGFFVFNHKPAKVFMGDVGSLALGGMLAAISMALHQEWTLLIIGIVYVFETTSVMMQVSYFKLTGGKRIFRMTPVHHHFELGGLSGKGNPWSEWKVDFFFWGVGLLASLLTLAILYLM